MGQPRLIQRPLGHAQGLRRLGGRLRTAQAAQPAGMNHNPVPAHPTDRQSAVVDIPQAVQPLLFIGGSQGDIIGRVEGHGDAVGLRLPLDRRGSFLRHPHAPSALVFEGVQPAPPQPGEHPQGGFVSLGVKRGAAARRAENRRHMDSPFAAGFRRLCSVRHFCRHFCRPSSRLFSRPVYVWR